MQKTTGLKKVKCPKCGYEMPVFYAIDAECKGIFLKCKGRRCGDFFEIKIKGNR